MGIKSVILEGEITIPAACVPAPLGNPSIFLAKSISSLTSSLVLYSVLSSLLTFNASFIVIPIVNGINLAI